MGDQVSFLLPGNISVGPIVYTELSKSGFKKSRKFPWFTFAPIPKVNMVFVKSGQKRYGILSQGEKSQKAGLKKITVNTLLEELNRKNSKIRLTRVFFAFFFSFVFS